MKFLRAIINNQILEIKKRDLDDSLGSYEDDDYGDDDDDDGLDDFLGSLGISRPK